MTADSDIYRAAGEAIQAHTSFSQNWTVAEGFAEVAVDAVTPLVEGNLRADLVAAVTLLDAMLVSLGDGSSGLVFEVEDVLRVLRGDEGEA